ncbi:hypothetical protein ACSBM8_04210 [Sphingomonas sp. ASY06-1R]|uniref:hypothetical protein n=1 Tax=Sphingomonas sp. ASY06-1R TaxID=3445771 RepID=UPI003FA2B34C
MLTLSSIVLFVLIAVAVLPLLLVGILFLFAQFNLPIPTKLVDVVRIALNVAWSVGAILNIVGGLALAAVAVWLPVHNPTRTHLVLAPLLVGAGLWRLWRGVTAFPRKG